MELPREGQIVFVHGGVAEYRNGTFYTGMEDPRFERPIQWRVTWWCPIDSDPRADQRRKEMARTHWKLALLAAFAYLLWAAWEGVKAWKTK